MKSSLLLLMTILIHKMAKKHCKNLVTDFKANTKSFLNLKRKFLRKIYIEIHRLLKTNFQSQKKSW